MPKLYKVEWIVFVHGSSPAEAAGFAVEIQGQPENTATMFRVDGELIDMPGDSPSENGWCYDADPKPPLGFVDGR